MATAAQNPQLPLFYQALEPVNVSQHGKMKVRPVLNMGQIGSTHAIPVTVDEFGLAQRHYPIVFSIGDNPIPIALMGLNEGINVFLDEKGRPIDPRFTSRLTSAAIRSCSPGFGPTATNCRCASTRPPTRSAISRTARHCSTATSRAMQPRPSCSSASSSNPPASAPAPSSRN